MVDQIWVYGNSYESTLVAIIVPDHRVLTAWAKDAGAGGDFAALCKSPKARAAGTLLLRLSVAALAPAPCVRPCTHVRGRARLAGSCSAGFCRAIEPPCEQASQHGHPFGSEVEGSSRGHS